MTPNYLIIVLIIVVVLFSTIYYLYNSTTKQVKNEPFSANSTASNPITVAGLSTQIMTPFTPESVLYNMVGRIKPIEANNIMYLLKKSNYIGTSYEGKTDAIVGVSIDFATGIINLTPTHTYKVSLVLNKVIYNMIDSVFDLDLLLETQSSSNIKNSKMSTTMSYKSDTNITLVLNCYLKNTQQIIPQIRPRGVKLIDVSAINTSVYLFIERIA